jgi:hypothetical protein
MPLTLPLAGSLSSSSTANPLGLLQQKTPTCEAKYSAFDRELLAAHLAIRHFRHFLEGRQFTLYTDHKPLTAALSKVSDAWSARQQRQLNAISEFTTDLSHVSGKDNVVVDLTLEGILGHKPVIGT